MRDTKVIDTPANGPKCPQCGTPLPTGALAGLCPACLLKLGAANDTVTDGKQPPFNPPPVAELAPLFPQLEILELIGKGGMGAVYKARQNQLDRIVALKILPPGIGDDPAFAERFAREAKALAKLNHPGIVTLYEFGQVGGLPSLPAKNERGESRREGQSMQSGQNTPPLPSPLLHPMEERESSASGSLFYFLMEFVDGVNLRQLLHAGRISPREALAIVPQICDALQFAHDQGIVHRDIKPENILLDRRGRVKVADFGLAKIVGNEAPLTPSLSPSDGERVAKPGEGTPALTDAGKVMGTPNYMAPEQVSHPAEVDHRADIYALGVVFYQMLTGELPGKPLQPPSRKVQMDVRLDEVVLRALEKRPELRYQQVSAFKTEVETVATDLRGGKEPVAAGTATLDAARVSAGDSAKPAAKPPPVKRALPYRRAVVVAVLVWLLVFLTSAVVTFILPESFSSTARIKIERDATDVQGMAGNRMNLNYDPYFIQTELETIQSEVVLGKVIDLLDLNNVWGAKFGGGKKFKTPDTIQILKSRMTLRPVRNTSLIEITVYGDDRTEAAKIANAIAEMYKDLRMRERVQKASSGIKALEDGYKQQQYKTHKAQEELDALRGALGLTDAEAKADGPVQLMDAENMRRMKAMSIENEAHLQSLQASVARLKALSKEELRQVLPRYRQDTRLTELLRRLGELEQQMQSVEKEFAPTHPKYQALKEQIENLQSQVDADILGIMTTLEVEVTAAQAQVEALKKSVPEAQKQDVEYSEKMRPYYEKKRELEGLINFARILNLKISAERIDLALPKPSMIEIVDRAQPGVKPVRPNKPLNLVLAAFLGMVLGLLAGALTLLPAALSRKPKASMT